MIDGNTETDTRKDEQPKLELMGLVKHDSYLEPFNEAIRGRHDHALWKLGQLTQQGKSRWPTLPAGMTTMDCTAYPADGCSESGLQMPLTSILWAILTDGKRMKTTGASVSKAPETGN